MSAVLDLAAANAMVAHAAQLVVEDATPAGQESVAVLRWRIEKLRDALAERNAVLARETAVSDPSVTVAP